MDEKEMFDLMNQIEEVDMKLLDESLDEETMNRIKRKTRSKLGINDQSNVIKLKKKKSHLKWLAASIILLLLIPVSATALSGLYKFDPELGDVIVSDKSVYSLAKEKTIVTSMGEATLLNFIYVEGEYATTTVHLKFDQDMDPSNLEIPFPVEKSGSLFINDEELVTKNFGTGSGSIETTFSHTFQTQEIIKAGDHISYEFGLSDGTTYTFDIELIKNEAAITYEALGPTDIKQDIQLTAIVNEENELLDINFITPNVANQQLIEYGNAYCEEYSKCGAVLRDATGKTVIGNKVFHHDRNNHFTFDTSNLTKPFTLELEQVTVAYYLADQDVSVKMSVPKLNETQTDVEALKILDFELPIKEVTLYEPSKDEAGQELNEGVVGELAILFDLNRDFGGDRQLVNFDISSSLSPFFKWFDVFDGYSSILDQKDDVYVIEERRIYLSRLTKDIKLEIPRIEVLHRGNWEFIIE
ncbi:MAG: hypothetical protein ACRCST_11940 [Turicibacter sp.]